MRTIRFWLGLLLIGSLHAGIPSPQTYLGVPIGERPLHHDEVVRYFQALAESTDRAQLVEYGKTHEGRSLTYLVISSESHMRDLETHRRNIWRLAHPEGLSEREAERLIRQTPAVAWMAYAIHGDELSSTDAAVKLAYRLVSGEDSIARMIRDSLIVIIDPLQNPDGRERFLAMIQSFSGQVPNPDLASLNHQGLWPWGRGNHYFIDLNRDWFTLVQPESRAKIRAILRWMPQLFVDSHEMGPLETYLFHPPRHPFNPYLHPLIQKWWKRLAEDQARAFDRHGWSYYTGEWNEEFFPGYGSSWSTFIGAIGILYEQAGVDGSLVKQLDRYVLTYKETVEHHFVSSMANLQTTARHRTEILRDYLRMKRDVLRKGKSGPIRAFIVSARTDPEGVQQLARDLLDQGIQVEMLEEDFTLSGLQDYFGHKGKVRLPKGSLRIRTDQPLYPLLRNILDFHVPMSDSFLREERAYLEKGEGSRLYEITAWGLLVARGLESYWTSNLAGPWRPYAPPPDTGALLNPDALYGFLLPGDRMAALRALVRLLDRDVQVRVALRDFRVEEHTFHRGDFLIRKQGNPPDLPSILREVARETGVTFFGVNTALTEQGPDLGGNYFRLLKPPRVGLFAFTPVSVSGMGAIWYLLDHEIGLRVSLLNIQQIRSTDLDRYNVLIVPPLWGNLKEAIGDAGLKKLRKWVESGGTLIAIGNAARSLLGDTTNFPLHARLRSQVLEDYPPPYMGPPPEAAEKLGAMKAEGFAPGDTIPSPDLRQWIPGVGSPVLGPGAQAFVPPQDWEGSQKALATLRALTKEEKGKKRLKKLYARMGRFRPRGTFLRAQLDTENVLCFGLREEVPVFVSQSFEILAGEGTRVAARFSEPDRLQVSGLLWPEAAARIAGTAYALQEGRERGQVILFSSHPVFRNWTRPTTRMFLNAVLIAPGTGTRHTQPWE